MSLQLQIPHGRGKAREESLTEFATVILKVNEQAEQKMSRIHGEIPSRGN
jgi:hypothetical protein